ncbi:MAG: hypothetical protein ACKOUT_13310 [Novosphingobium sp.]
MFASRKLALCGSIAWCAAVGLSMPVSAQTSPASGPVARYDMRAGTVTGMGAMGGGMRGAMGMAFGGGGGSAPQHELYLRLGSVQPPVKSAPKADHFMPPAVKLGKSVPLLTPQAERGARDELPQMGNEKPRGRMLIFWGCGEHAPKGQPVIIDFAKLSAGQMPPGMWSSTVLRDWGPTLANSKTFGRWPNDDTMGGNKTIRSDASLIGAHRVAGNYSPEIAFTLAKDFMAGLTVRTSSLPSGAGMLRWNAVPDATGYYATLFGGKQGPNGEMGDMVMWSSSATRQFGGGLQDWLSPSQVSPLVTNKTVLPPTATACILPAEVKAATEFRMGTLTAFGPEENFSYPPRPSDPKAAWALQWTSRIRHRSSTSWMDMPGMSGGMPGDMASEEGEGREAPRPNCKPKGLGGIMGGVLTGRTGC